MNTTKSIAEIATLRAAALKDLLSTTDDDFRQEAREDGEDLEGMAIQMKSAMRNTASAVLRERMTESKVQMRPALALRSLSLTRPAIDRIKTFVQELFANDRSLGLAFREGKRQSDADWQSLYDDLVAMGAIKADDDVL
jgi:hypothetical protein